MQTIRSSVNRVFDISVNAKNTVVATVHSSTTYAWTTLTNTKEYAVNTLYNTAEYSTARFVSTKKYAAEKTSSTKQYLLTQWAWVYSYLQALYTSIFGFATTFYTQGFTYVKSLYQTLSTYVLSLYSQLYSYALSFYNATYAYLLSWYNTGYSYLLSWYKAAYTYLLSLYNNAYDYAFSLYKYAYSFVLNLYKNTYSFVLNLYNNTYAVLLNLYNNAYTYVLNLFKTTYAYLISLYQRAYEYVVSLYKKTYEYVLSLVNSIVNYVVSLYYRIRRTVLRIYAIIRYYVIFSIILFFTLPGLVSSYIFGPPKRVPKLDHSHRARVAVVGGGIAGTSAAWALKKQGFHVTVYESKAILGGNARTQVWNDKSGDIITGLSVLAWPNTFFKNYNALLHALKIKSESVELPFMIVDSRSSSRSAVAAGNVYAHTIPDTIVGHAAVLKRWFLLLKFVRIVNKIFGYFSGTYDERSLYNGLSGIALLNPLNFIPLYYLSRLFLVPRSFYDNIFIPLYSSTFLTTDLYSLPAVMLPVLNDIVPLASAPSMQTWSSSSNSNDVFEGLTANIDDVRLNADIERVDPQLTHDNRQVVVVQQRNGKSDMYDRVIFACPANVIAPILANPSRVESLLLSNVEYTEHGDDGTFLTGIVHRDESVLPSFIRQDALHEYANLVEIVDNPVYGGPSYRVHFLLSPWIPSVKARELEFMEKNRIKTYLQTVEHEQKIKKLSKSPMKGPVAPVAGVTIPDIEEPTNGQVIDQGEARKLWNEREKLEPLMKEREAALVTSVKVKGQHQRLQGMMVTYTNETDKQLSIDQSLVMSKVSNALSHPQVNTRNLYISAALRLIQGSRGLYYASSYATPGNGHDLSLLSGLVAAEAVGASYPFAGNEEATKDFNRLKKIMGF